MPNNARAEVLILGMVSLEGSEGTVTREASAGNRSQKPDERDIRVAPSESGSRPCG